VLLAGQVLQRGSFGGTYFRSIHSEVTNKTYGNDEWKEYPQDWFEGGWGNRWCVVSRVALWIAPYLCPRDWISLINLGRVPYNGPECP
jgi:hypothetical protein